MSTIQQDMTDAAVVWEHLAKRMANELGDGSEEAWKQATQIHAAATILHGFADKRKVKLRAAVDDDAPKCKYNKDVDQPCTSYYARKHPFGVCHRGVDVGPCDTSRTHRHNCPLYAPVDHEAWCNCNL